MISSNKFHTQSAFKFLAEANEKYRITFKNHGKEIKMVDFSVSYIVPSVSKAILTEETEISLKPMVEELEGMFKHWEQNLMIKQEEDEEKSGKFRKFFIYSTWEMALIIGVMVAQVFTIRKITDDYSIV